MTMLQDDQSSHVYMNDMEPMEQTILPPSSPSPPPPPPPPVMYLPQPPPQQYIFDDKPKSTSIFELDKSMYILLLVAFMLGLFIGKNMQPIIIRAP